MFDDANAFNQDIGDWNVGKVPAVKSLIMSLPAFLKP
jgi:hypothetical protein